MAVQLFCYLNFPGNTREALAYYQEVFGGEAAISTFGEYGIEGVPADGIMHAQLVTPAFTIMASDALAGAEQEWAGSRIHLALMGDDLEAVPETVRLARRANRVIWQNIVFSIVVKAVFLVLAPLGLISLWLAVFADMGTSLLVTGNGLRLQRR